MDARVFNRACRRIDAAGFQSVTFLPSSDGYMVVMAEQQPHSIRLRAPSFSELILALADACPPLEEDCCGACGGDGQGTGIAVGFACGRCGGSGREP